MDWTYAGDIFVSDMAKCGEKVNGSGKAPGGGGRAEGLE